MACILILEDDEISARLATRMLRTRGHEVHAALKSDVAWVRLQESPVDVMLLDTQLDGELGWEVLARIRDDILFRELPVIVYSSVAQRDVIQRYLALGVQGILVKPASAERLNQEVDRVIVKQWRKKLFESEEAVQARTGLMPTEVTRLYHDAAEELRGAVPDLNALADDFSHAAGLARLSALKSCSVNIGYLRLTQMVERMQAAVAAADQDAFRKISERMTAALRMLVIHSGAEEAQPAEAGASEGSEASASSN